MRGIQVEMTDQTKFGKQKLVVGRSDDGKSVEMHATVDDKTVKLLIPQAELAKFVKMIGAV